MYTLQPDAYKPINIYFVPGIPFEADWLQPLVRQPATPIYHDPGLKMHLVKANC